MEKILLIKTYRSVGIGGPLFPLDLLYISSNIFRKYKDEYKIKIFDMGAEEISFDKITDTLKKLSPKIVCISSMIWEADLTHKISKLVKEANKNCTVIVLGQLASIACERLFCDRNIDFVIKGEADVTIVELIDTISKNKKHEDVDGVCFIKDNNFIETKSRELIQNLDDFPITEEAWDLINVPGYSRYQNWNGQLKKSFYMPILTSRGCPFSCEYCCNRELLGSKFRARSPENVISEIKFLTEKYNVKEIHVFDAVFNFDMDRAKKICKLLIESGVKISLAFPHGLRADCMDDELIGLLKQCGTYKITYGVETATPRLQKLIKKNLDIKRVKEVVKKTSKKGIIVSGYFMLGFPTQTEDEILETIDFAVSSHLDVASFFKVTLYDELLSKYEDIFKAMNEKTESKFAFEDFSYYSKKRSCCDISAEEVNKLILKAQKKFYFNFKRVIRGLIKYPHKIRFLKNLFSAYLTIFQSYLIGKIVEVKKNSN